MSKDKQIHCDACGGKLQHPYARLADKQYCRRSCYEEGIKEKCQKELNDKMADGHHHEEATRKICQENNMKDCATCGKPCPTPFAFDVGNGRVYCSPTCYVQSLVDKKPKITDYEYPDNRRDDMPYNDEEGC